MYTPKDAPGEGEAAPFVAAISGPETPAAAGRMRSVGFQAKTAFFADFVQNRNVSRFYYEGITLIYAVLFLFTCRFFSFKL
jgi:hypothetical protein